MFGRQDFISCVTDALKTKGYGPKRASQIIEDYKWRISEYERQGVASNEAGMRAMTDTFNHIASAVADKAAGQRKNLTVLAGSATRLERAPAVRTSGLIFDGKSWNGPGTALARGLISLIAHDGRFVGTDFVSMARIRAQRYWSMFEGVADQFSKGAFGRQLGAVHFRDVVRELHGEATGNTVAKMVADTYTKVQNLMADDFRLVGGAMDKRKDFRLPQMQNMVKILRGGRDAWVAQHMEWLDWDAMRFPDGDPIPPADRERVLHEVYSTLATDGATKIDPTFARGQGRAMGNAIDNHRFLLYKDSASWEAMHATYGDGTVFDVVSKHIERMSKRIALVDQFGRNPELMSKAMIAQGRKRAGDIAATAKADGATWTKGRREAALRAQSDFEVVSKRFDMMMQDVLGAHAGDANGTGATAIHATANILNGVLLAGSLFANVASDTAQMVAVRMSNHTSLHAGILHYLRTVMPGGYRSEMKIAMRAGFVNDELTGATYAAERWSGVATYGPKWSKIIGDVTLRASGLGRHTNTARWVTQAETMGMMHDARAIPFDQLPWRGMAERYGITSADWDHVRKNAPTYTPKPGVEFLTPISILETKHADKDKLFMKFANMVDAESRNMIPDSSLEARTYLRQGTNANNLPGALMHSFSMYKNYPITFMQLFGKHTLSLEKFSSKAAFTAALGLGTLGTGALAMQLNELRQGRTVMPMNTAAFWGKVLLNSGGLGIWGNYLFTGINDQTGNAASGLVGPLFGLATDGMNLVAGDSFAFMNTWDTAQRFTGHFGQRLTQFVKDYAPGSRLWYAKLLLEREIWDRLEEWTDPKVAQKRRNRVRRQEKAFGNTYYAPPGQRLLTGR